MKVKTVLILLACLIFLVISSSLIFLQSNGAALFNPKGFVAKEQFEFLKFAVTLSLFGLVPAISLTFFVAWKYRDGREHSSEETKSKNLQIVFWLVPFLIILLLAFFTWDKTHKLDPFKKLDSDKEPLTVQVIALRWKWLFIYPKQDIASVNFLEFPEKTPLQFKLTSDNAPMNSFWIPQLGGQMYAMTGMETRLNLIANSTGEFSGSAAEISGSGFSGMRFVAKSVSYYDFENWVKKVKNSEKSLTLEEYTKLSNPSENYPVTFYSSQESIFDNILDKYMPTSKHYSQPY